MTKKPFDQEFVEYVVKSIVKNENDVKVERIVDEKGVLITVYVNPEDAGLVVGKKGATISALRDLLRIIGLKRKAWINLRLIQPEKPGERPTLEK